MTRISSATARVEKLKMRYHPWAFSENLFEYISFVLTSKVYSGSLSRPKFFLRLTHSHPVQVVWLFHVIIALSLMELDVFNTLLWVLGLYSNMTIALPSALLAGMVINNLLGLSPCYIEFKYAHLYNFNPVALAQ